MSRLGRLAVAVIVLLATGLASAQGIPDSLRSFGRPEREQIMKSLELQGMNEADIGFDKKWAVDSFFRFRIVDDLLDHPLHGPDYCDSSALLVERFRENLPAL